MSLRIADSSAGSILILDAGIQWGFIDTTNPADESWTPSPLERGITRVIRSGSARGWPNPIEPGNWTPSAQTHLPRVLEQLQRARSESNHVLLLPDARDLVSDAPGALKLIFDSQLDGIALDPSALITGSLCNDAVDFIDRIIHVVAPRTKVFFVRDFAVSTVPNGSPSIHRVALGTGLLAPHLSGLHQLGLSGVRLVFDEGASQP